MNIKIITKSLLVTATLLLTMPFASNNLTYAQGIDIDLGVPSGDPIFEITNMLPGDVEQRNIKVTNTSGSPTVIFVRCEEIEELKNFSMVLDMVVIKDGNDIYGGSQGSMTVEEFCEAAQVGLNLGLVGDNDEVIYTFKATFPSSAGNEYQEAKYVFDLIFQTKSADNLVINEVYYLVDDEHGLDCRGDRNLIIAGNGPGSTNTIDLRYNNSCFIVQSNQTNISNHVSSSANSGRNSSLRNSASSIITTGGASSGVNIFTFGGFNFSFGSCCCGGSSHNDEWVEIYNPTDRRISLKNWGLIDNSGELTKIHSNTIVQSEGFVLISRDSSTWRRWNEPRRTRKVRLGREIGDGLDNAGDHLYLVNPDGEEVDFTAWGNDTKRWNPAVLLVPLGSSMERLTPGFDTDMPEDWEPRNPPTPGE